METLKQEIAELIQNKLKRKFVFEVNEKKDYFGNGKYLAIWIACSDHNINRVCGQKPQIISLMLTDKLELSTQIFGGNGGRCIYRKPNLELAEEKYLAMKSVKLPFRTPKPEIDKVKATISKFIDNYIQALKDNRTTLFYQDIVNYDELLGL